jgi:hypothetical protein
MKCGGVAFDMRDKYRVVRSTPVSKIEILEGDVMLSEGPTSIISFTSNRFT